VRARGTVPPGADRHRRPRDQISNGISAAFCGYGFNLYLA
jgi:hypothetical protein